MTPQRWDRLKLAFDAAREAGALDPDLLSDDPDLRADVGSLLAEDAAADGALESPPWAVLTSPDLFGPPVSRHDEPPMLAPGQQVAGYTVEALIGRGGMGEVYRATQTRPRRTVALKVIRAGLVSERLMRRLGIEAAILARLEHPGVARIIEAGELTMPGPPGRLDERSVVRPFFSMELVEGVPITQHAQERGLDTRARVELMRLVCEAVEHAHQRGVIHRDLKPANILIDAQSRPKVLDFGVAMVVDGSDTMQSNTLVVPGTPAYMSPEQASGDPGGVGTPSDVYSLGVVLYELLTGRLPIDPKGVSVWETLRAVREATPVRPGVIRRELRGDLEAVMLAALEKDPARRYASAGALRADLVRFQNGEPLTIRRPSAGYLLRIFARRHWRELTAASLALAIGLGVATWQFTRALRAEHVARARLIEIRRGANELVSELCGRLNTFTSIAQAQQFLAGEAMQRLEKLASESGDDPETLWSLSRAYLRLGMATGHPAVPNTGNQTDAVRLIGRSLHLGERVLAMQPDSIPRQSEVGHTAALLAQAVADRRESAPLMERALQLQERVVRASPESAAALHDLAYRLVGDGYLRARAGEAFEAPFGRAEGILRDLVAREPGSPRWADTLGCALSVHAEALGRLDHDASVVKYEECRAVMIALLVIEPGNYSAIRHIAKADGALALQHCARGRGDDADTLALGAVATHREWLAKETTNTYYRLDLVDALLIVAKVRGAGSSEAVNAASEARGLLLSAGAREQLPAEELERLSEAERLSAPSRPKGE